MSIFLNILKHFHFSIPLSRNKTVFTDLKPFTYIGVSIPLSEDKTPLRSALDTFARSFQFH